MTHRRRLRDDEDWEENTTPQGKRMRMSTTTTTSRQLTPMRPPALVRQQRVGRHDNEEKWIDQDTGGVSILVGVGGQTVLSSANGVGQGTGNNQRIGLKQQMKSFQIKGYIYNDGAIANANCWNDEIHLWVVLDRHPNTVGTVWLDVFDTSSEPANAMMNLSNTTRYRLLKHIVVKMTPPVYYDTNINQARVGTDANSFEWFTDLNFVSRYTAGSTTGGWADFTENNIIVFASANRCTEFKLAYRSRCRYTDA